MGDVVENVQESLKVKRTFKNKYTVSKRHRSPKNTFRRIRKNRSKVRYYKSLKKLRYNRKTDDLCSAVKVFDITDMEWTPACSSTSLPPDVAEWQKQDQIAYWKSRAISLQLENRMLHQHLRDVYTKTIEDNLQINKATEVPTGSVEDKVEENKCPKKVCKGKSGTQSNTKRPVSPNVPSGKNRLEEMKKIYGDAAQKIMGMETALQLNYEKLVEQSKAPYWPSIPLCLKFD